MAAANPILVELTRGPKVESRHRGAAMVADAGGRVVAQWGDVARTVFPRSALKPVQALPLLESGAADALGVGDEELALACGSHNGEPIHVETVTRWLARIGLAGHHLRCGPHPPQDERAARDLYRAGGEPEAIHNNCSGKHAGMLTTAVHLNEGIADYAAPGHPVQRRVAQALAELTGLEADALPAGTDGCGLPAPALPLTDLAVAMARLGHPDDSLPQPCGRAAARVLQAMGRHPYMVAGRDRFDTRVMEAAEGTILCKRGAEGVQVAILPERGLGIAVKIDDGTARAAETAMAALLLRHGEPGERVRETLQSYARRPLHNWNGTGTGQIRVSGRWLAV